MRLAILKGFNVQWQRAPTALPKQLARYQRLFGSRRS